MAIAFMANAAFAQTTYFTSVLGIVPSDGNDDTLSLHNAVAALVSGDTLVFDVAGDYELSLVAGFTPVLALAGKSNVTIKSSVSGVRLLLTKYLRSNVSGTYPNLLEVWNCPGFTLAGLNASSPIVFDTRGALSPPGPEGLPFLQGTILSVTPATNTARIKVTDPAMFFPFPITYTPTCWAWTFRMASSPSSPPYFPQPIHAQYDGTVKPVAAPGGGLQLVDLVFNGPGAMANWTPGGEVVAPLNDSETYAILIYNCSGTVTIRDLVANHLPGKFVQIGDIQNLVIDNVDVAPAIAGRRLSVNRDGVNVAGESLVVRNCDVIGTGDDGIVANGTAWGVPVPCSHNPTAMTFMLKPAAQINPWPTTCLPGQLIALVDKNAGMSAGSTQFATVVGTQTFPQPGGVNWIQYSYASPSPGFATLLNPSVPGDCSTPLRGLAFNPSCSQSGGLVQDCTVASIRGVGLTVRSLKTTVTQCTVSDTLECGIQAGGGMVSAYPWFGAGAPPHLLTIKNCTLTRNGTNPFTATRGAIELAVAESSVPQGSCPNSFWINPVYSSAGDVILDATLSFNTIREFPRAGVFAANVGGASGIQVLGNSFINSGPADPCHPEHGFGVAVETCGSGLVQGNTFVNCAAGKFLQHASPNVVFIP